jgi:curved DNA-binding protein CbpA
VERSRNDLYRVLQVDPSANQLVIQAAYRVLAQIFHPDVSGDEAEMKRLNAAWEVLGDVRRRKQYDIERAGRHPGAVERAASSSGTASHAAPMPAPAPRPAAPSVQADYRTSAFSTASSAASAAEAPIDTVRHGSDHAGPPPGRPFGPVLRFGRYDGWSLGEIAGVDRPYLEWLRRVPAGRGMTDDIDAVMQTRRGPGAVDARRHYETNQQKVHSWAPGAPTKVR